jgi:hypothetical protein
MGVATAGQVLLLDSYEAELGVLQAHPHNLLLEGPSAATDAALLLLQPHLRDPLISTPRTHPLSLEGTIGSLILRDVAALDACDQARLLAWLQGEGFGVQVVSTTSCCASGQQVRSDRKNDTCLAHARRNAWPQ